ncbi:MAG: tRNA (adenosine(37)-N6)-threonylcarbamoyltransferase complex transferase subunit TsaD [Pseudomonadota bacterium]|jgi:N6-L-threonylcarbamoyladenine synthase|nr:tRNA (adenosine(37)-N6)-threonylcarbamoyltransferase complex transferase subunit TsaD [Alphaproteobacteria bacterium]
MIILAIETSCDETSISILQDSDIDKRILSLVTRSQVSVHQDYGGVVPELAARAHLSNIEPIMEQALAQAKIELKDIDAIAVTGGPGLIGGVLVGVTLAKALHVSLNKPLYCINHLEGHALTARLSHDVAYPYLLLLTSGGHCMFMEVLGFRQYVLLGQTLDDAAGECFDKIAKLLDFDFPGGPTLEKKAKLGDPTRFIFPKPLQHEPVPNFSFSGLKTAVKQTIEKSTLDEQTVCDIAASFQYTVGEIFKERLSKALKCSQHKVERLVMAGGVAANRYLREQLQHVCANHGIEAIFPPMNLCVDNAAMIGWVGIEAIQHGVLPSESDFQPRPRWPLEQLHL